MVGPSSLADRDGKRSPKRQAPPALTTPCEWLGLSRWHQPQPRQSREICPETNRKGIGSETGCVCRVEMGWEDCSPFRRRRQWRSSRHTRKQPWPGYQPYRSLSSHGLQIDSAFSGFNWLVGSGLGKRRRLFLKERSCIGQPRCLPPRPAPSRGQMGQQADTVLTPPCRARLSMPAVVG